MYCFSPNKRRNAEHSTKFMNVAEKRLKNSLVGKDTNSLLVNWSYRITFKDRQQKI